MTPFLVLNMIADGESMASPRPATELASLSKLADDAHASVQDAESILTLSAHTRGRELFERLRLGDAADGLEWCTTVEISKTISRQDRRESFGPRAGDSDELASLTTCCR